MLNTAMNKLLQRLGHNKQKKTHRKSKTQCTLNKDRNYKIGLSTVDDIKHDKSKELTSKIEESYESSSTCKSLITLTFILASQKPLKEKEAAIPAKLSK